MGWLADWIADDITWCAREGCPILTCPRNTCNMRDRTGVHSFAMFRGTRDCPVSERAWRVMDEDCIASCDHAWECFSENQENIPEALRQLAEQYCDGCPRGEKGED